MSKELEEAIYMLNEYKKGTWIKKDDLFNSIDTVVQQAERVQELERKLDRVRFVNDIFLEKEKQQNKRYREAIGFGIEYLKNSDIRQVQLVVTALKSALEGGE